MDKFISKSEVNVDSSLIFLSLITSGDRGSVNSKNLEEKNIYG